MAWDRGAQNILLSASAFVAYPVPIRPSPDKDETGPLPNPSPAVGEASGAHSGWANEILLPFRPDFPSFLCINCIGRRLQRILSRCLASVQGQVGSRSEDYLLRNLRRRLAFACKLRFRSSHLVPSIASRSLGRLASRLVGRVSFSMAMSRGAEWALSRMKLEQISNSHSLRLRSLHLFPPSPSTVDYRFWLHFCLDHPSLRNQAC